MIHTLAQIDRLWNVLELFNSVVEWSDYSRIHTLICIESQFANDLHLYYSRRLEIGLKASIADTLSWSLGRRRWHVNTAIKSLLSISCRRKDRLICEDGAGKDIGGTDQAKRGRRGGRGRAAKKLCAGILKEAIPNLGHTWWWHDLNIFSDGKRKVLHPILHRLWGQKNRIARFLYFIINTASESSDDTQKQNIQINALKVPKIDFPCW